MVADVEEGGEATIMEEEARDEVEAGEGVEETIETANRRAMPQGPM